jgi:hypothetical protein
MMLNDANDANDAKDAKAERSRIMALLRTFWPDLSGEQSTRLVG